MKQATLKAIGLILLLVSSLVFNVAVHELSHFLVADKFNLKPEIHVSDNGLGAAFSFNSESVAYTSYLGSSSDIQDKLIALAGPLSNLLIALAGMGLFLALPKKFKTDEVKLIFIAFVLPALVAFLSNILPLAGTDGAVLLGALL